MGWEHFSHEADVGIRGRGATMAEAFAEAGRALTGVVTDPAGVRDGSTLAIRVQADDPEMLLFDWLNALVYEMATRHVLFARFDVRIDGDRLQATVGGEPVDVVRHQPAVEVKGATWTGLRVARDEDGTWIAQCVVDV